jgi:hypothetical protein
MAGDRPKLGETLRLTGTSRRQFLKLMASAGTGAIGLETMIEKVYGKKPEGKPIVHTYDFNGHPKRIRIIPKERHRRLSVFKNYPFQDLIDKHPSIEYIDVVNESGSETDLKFRFHLNRHDWNVRKKLPNRIRKVPIVYEKSEFEAHPHRCDSRHGEQATIEGGIAIDNGSSWGTLGLVFRDKYDPGRYLITADHVMSGTDNMYQAGRTIGDFRSRDQASNGSGEDITMYKYKDGSNYHTDHLGTRDSRVQEVTGAWDYYGLLDVVDSGFVYCQTPGANNCYIKNRVNHVGKYGAVQHQVDMDYARNENGDSGSPWVDNNGNLVMLTFGTYSNWHGDTWGCGAAAVQALAAVGADPEDVHLPGQG